MAREILSAGGTPVACGIRVRLEPVADLDRLGEAWRGLEARSAPSFFRSWGWVGCWLRHLPPDRRPLAAIATRDGAIVGLGVFVASRERRKGIVSSRVWRLHESGEPQLDSLCIEDNGLLADRAHEGAVWRAVLEALRSEGGGYEVVLAGLERRTAELCVAAAGAPERCVGVRQQRRAAHLDLADLRRSGRGLADALSRNTRHQLARSRRLYEARGALSLRLAQSVEEALAMLDALKALHQRSWQSRGQPGCFAAPRFEAFHRDLIRARFESGEVQLLRAAAGDRPIGYLYNFAYGDRIYAYQSGFDYGADGRLKPGLVSHALAIERALGDGFAVYDFMAGENRLKASFASHWREMAWLSIRPAARRLSLWPGERSRVASAVAPVEPTSL